MNNSNLDSLIFSVTYENYIKNISIDKPDKKLGKMEFEWANDQSY
jgi:hypothetical protein